MKKRRYKTELTLTAKQLQLLSFLIDSWVASYDSGGLSMGGYKDVRRFAALLERKVTEAEGRCERQKSIYDNLDKVRYALKSGSLFK